MKSVLKFLLNVAIYAVIVAGIVWGLPKYLSSKFGTQYPIASITSASMWPSLHRGDMIFIQAVPKEALAPGDVVVWQNPKGFTVHRLVRVNENGTMVTKGDANFKDDEPVALENLIGRVVTWRGKNMRIPYIGYVTIKLSGYIKR